jgi:dCMP deaminase
MITARDIRYYLLAVHVAGWSKDPTTKVGAVIVGRDPREVALGYNGFPPGIADTPDRLNDRETKHRLTQHAERNALDNAKFDVAGGTMYCTQIPCTVHGCSKSIISKGVARVVCPRAPQKEPWRSDAAWTEALFAEAGVVLEYVDPDQIGGK